MSPINLSERYYQEQDQWWYVLSPKGKRMPYEVRTKAILSKCAHCLKTYLTIPSRTKRGGKQGSYCSRICGSRASGGHRGRAGELSHLWKGGKRTARGGYIEVYAPNHPSLRGTKRKYVREHRLVMEATLQRYLEPWEEVHHLNAVRDDNRPENLELWVKSHPAGARYYQAVKHCPSCSCSSDNLN